VLAVHLLLVFCWSIANAQPPPNPGAFCAGVYADESRTLDCVNGLPGASFVLYLWAWVPPDTGLAYITLRFDLPANLDLTARPTFHDQVTGVIIADYPDGTVEWTMLVVDCPTGWIRVFTQACVISDAEPAAITIIGQHSMMRDCEFVLNDIEVLNALTVNDPDCEMTALEKATWGAVKRLWQK